jgi:hypothetical protein
MLVDLNRRGMERVREIAKGFEITAGDIRGPILSRAAAVHRKQEARIFASEGGVGASGRWPALSPEYAEHKRRALSPRRPKILVWSGDMKERFLTPSRKEYIERAVQRGKRWVLQFGASSEIAGYHYEGGPNLPKRDMITKTARQIGELRRSLVEWYRTERVPQVRRALAVAARQSRYSQRRAFAAIRRARALSRRRD